MPITFNITEYLKDIFGPDIGTITVKATSDINDLVMRQRAVTKTYTVSATSAIFPCMQGQRIIVWGLSVENDLRAASGEVYFYPTVIRTLGPGGQNGPVFRYPKPPAAPAAGECGCMIDSGTLPIVMNSNSSLLLFDSAHIGVDVSTFYVLYTLLIEGVDYI